MNRLTETPAHRRRETELSGCRQHQAGGLTSKEIDETWGRLMGSHFAFLFQLAGKVAATDATRGQRLPDAFLQRFPKSREIPWLK